MYYVVMFSKGVRKKIEKVLMIIILELKVFFYFNNEYVRVLIMVYCLGFCFFLIYYVI